MLFSRWKIHAIINCNHGTKTYTNSVGSGEVTTWDLVDDTGSINLVAFNLQSNSLNNLFVLGRVMKLKINK